MQSFPLLIIIIIDNQQKRKMQERHIDRKRYFEEQAQTSEKYYLPYVKNVLGHLPTRVLEVGCGEGGNLLPFAERGCETVGVDIAALRIEQAHAFFAEKKQKGMFVASDIFQLKELAGRFPLILIHDVIEHIGEKSRFLSDMKCYLSAGGVIFVAFPAWQMPFGGHQQIARGKVISHLPFLHLLPVPIYQWILKQSGEEKGTIEELLSIKKTRCTIEMFRTVARQAGYQIVDQQLYLVNPHYEIKFGLSPRKLWKVIASIPYIRNFFSTSCFYVLRKASL